MPSAPRPRSTPTSTASPGRSTSATSWCCPACIVCWSTSRSPRRAARGVRRHEHAHRAAPVPPLHRGRTEVADHPLPDPRRRRGTGLDAGFDGPLVTLAAVWLDRSGPLHPRLHRAVVNRRVSTATAATPAADRRAGLLGAASTRVAAAGPSRRRRGGSRCESLESMRVAGVDASRWSRCESLEQVLPHERLGPARGTRTRRGTRVSVWVWTRGGTWTGVWDSDQRVGLGHLGARRRGVVGVVSAGARRWCRQFAERSRC